MTSSSCENLDEFVIITSLGLVAQLVEQRTENPCVGGSIPPRATNKFMKKPAFKQAFSFSSYQIEIRNRRNKQPTL